MPNFFIIAGCNGAGKTTASFNMLPNILECKEFLNADEIAKGISPFQPETVSIEAGRIMLQRIQELMHLNIDFAVETTLSSLIYKNKIKEAQALGYTVSLLFFYLNNVNLAIQRVQKRVSLGGHNIPEETIKRRYASGINHFFNIYESLCENVMFFDNSGQKPELVMERKIDRKTIIYKSELYDKIKENGK